MQICFNRKADTSNADKQIKRTRNIRKNKICLRMYFKIFIFV